MIQETPTVKELSAIRPDYDQRRALLLVYPNLKSSVESQDRFMPQMWGDFLNAEAGSVGEEYQATQIALQFMLKTALATTEADNPESRELWSERYTQHTAELFGVPSTDVAKYHLSEQLNELFWSDKTDDKDRHAVAAYIDQFGLSRGSVAEAESHSENRAAEAVGEHLSEKYESIFQLVDDVEGSSDGIEMEVVAEVFEAALGILKDQHDEGWSEWSVARIEERAHLSVEPSESKISVGMNRVNPTRTEIKGLLAHELLVHGSRAMNGRKYSKELGLGLAGYLTAEEGLGVFFEYAITGVIPEKNIDRYVDIALALGLVSEKPLSRQQLLDFCIFRETLRNKSRPESQQSTQKEVVERMTEHVNRIYRGSLGNQHIGVFTKDAAYHIGFMKMKGFIEEKLEAGESIDDVIEFLLQGKFDPTNLKHVAYVKKAMDDRI